MTATHDGAFSELSRLDLNLAITFLAIWQERSVSKAAAQLSLTQSAVSGALARLRKALGDPLFVRVRGMMEPTPRAFEIATKFKFGVGALADAFTEPDHFDPACARTRFLVGMSDDLQLAMAPRLVQHVSGLAPLATVQFVPSEAHNTGTLFEMGEIDVALVAQLPERSWLNQEVIGTCAYACLLDSWACQADMPLSKADFQRLPHLSVRTGERESVLDAQLAAGGMERHVQVSITQHALVPAFLKGKGLIATLPLHAAYALAQGSRLSLCPPPMALPRANIVIAERRTTQHTPALNWFRTQLRDVAQQVLSQGEQFAIYP
jgi:DNA-binding transcriptional LysR family regulator